MYILKVKFLNRWYPKAGKQVESGDWQIVRAKVIEQLEGIDEEFETEFGQITLVGNMVLMEPDAECPR